MGKKSKRKAHKGGADAPAADGGGDGEAAAAILPADMTRGAALQVLRKVFSSMGKEEWWFLMDQSSDAIATCLHRDNFVVVDNFLGEARTAKVKAEVHKAWKDGALNIGRVAGGKTGGSLSYTMAQVRGDHMGWFDGTEPGMEWEGLRDLLKKIDTLVQELGGHSDELKEVTVRSKAMATVYPGGDSAARYTRHCDNPNQNGRKLTALFYLNSDWVEGDGGELRVYRCLRNKNDLEGFTDCDGKSLKELDTTLATGDPKDGDLRLPKTGRGEGTADDAVLRGVSGGGHAGTHPVKVCDVPPRGDRLFLFWSDARVPHEVLPARVDRYAVTTWYFSGTEVEAARAAGTSAEAIEADEIKARAEIERMQERYGAPVAATAPRGNNEPLTMDGVVVAAAPAGGSSGSSSGGGGEPGGARDKGGGQDTGPWRVPLVPMTAAKGGGAPAHAAGAGTEGAGGALEMRSLEVGLEALVLCVGVPGAAGAGDVDLQVEPREVRVGAPGRDDLIVPLPLAVDVEGVAARWSKKKGQLTVTLPKT